MVVYGCISASAGEGSRCARDLQPLETAGSAGVDSALPISDPLAQIALEHAALSLLLRLNTQFLAADAGTAWVVASLFPTSSQRRGWEGPSKNHLPPLPLLPQVIAVPCWDQQIPAAGSVCCGLAQGPQPPDANCSRSTAEAALPAEGIGLETLSASVFECWG